MPNPWLIRNDGIVDSLAIETAARGARTVRLTVLERDAAAMLILAAGGSTDTIVDRLKVSKPTACTIARRVRRVLAIDGAASRAFPGAPVTIPAAS